MNGSRLSRDRARGIILIVISASLFAVVDGISKILADTQSVGQIVLARYALAIPVLLATSASTEWVDLLRTTRPGMQISRALMPLIIGGAMVLSVHNLPLADATAILFAGPLLVVLLSASLLGERVRPASWVGVGLGFAAVLMVVRPGVSAVSVWTAFPLIAAACYAAFQLLSRALGTTNENPSTTVAWTLATGLVVAIPLAALTWAPVSPTAWLLMILMGLAFGAAQALMARGFVYAPANVLTPFTYAQIVAAVIFGVIAFGTVPEPWTLLGIALITFAGSYVVSSQRYGA